MLVLKAHHLRFLSGIRSANGDARGFCLRSTFGMPSGTAELQQGAILMGPIIPAGWWAGLSSLFSALSCEDTLQRGADIYNFGFI